MKIGPRTTFFLNISNKTSFVDFENECPRGGVLARFVFLRGRGFAPFFVPGGWGNCPFKKFSGGSQGDG